MEKTIEQIAADYLKAKADAEQAKTRQEEIGVELKKRLVFNNGCVKVGSMEVKLQGKETILFDDAILPYLKTSGLQTYVRETVDDAGLKKAIKKSEILKDQLKLYITIKSSQSIVTALAKE